MRVQAKTLILVLLAACSRPPEGSPTAAAMAYVRTEQGALKEGEDYTIKNVETLTQAEDHVIVRVSVLQGDKTLRYHLRINRGERWAVALDYEKSFRKEVVEVSATWERIAADCKKRMDERHPLKETRLYRSPQLMMPTTQIPELRDPEEQLIVAAITTWRSGIHFGPGSDGKTLVPFGFVSFEFDYHPRGNPAGGLYTQEFGWEKGRWFALGTHFEDRVR